MKVLVKNPKQNIQKYEGNKNMWKSSECTIPSKNTSIVLFLTIAFVAFWKKKLFDLMKINIFYGFLQTQILKKHSAIKFRNQINFTSF